MSEVNLKSKIKGMSFKRIYFYVIIVFFAIYVYLQKKSSGVKNQNSQFCIKKVSNNTTVCRLNCPNGTFALPGMKNCHPWLRCGDPIKLNSIISFSVVKTVFLAKWKSYDVVLSTLSSKQYQVDMNHHLVMMKSLSSSYVIQLLGFCNNSIVSEYYELGNALNVHYHLQKSFKFYDTIFVRLNLCISYVLIIEYLHSSPLGMRVMCDSNTIEKTLSQYLLTDDFILILNDMDALPEIKKGSNGIICGHHALSGPFIAPEQRWPYPDLMYDEQKMHSYDEKTDIWKIPDVCNWLLGNSPAADVLKYNLFSFHKQCKSIEPKNRPNATVICNKYKELLKNL